MVLMRDEVLEQPKAVEKALKEGLPLIRNIARRISAFQPDLIFIAARGTSDNAATYARYLFEAGFPGRTLALYALSPSPQPEKSPGYRGFAVGRR